MIDIHTHVIPALDDGPSNMETSIRMGYVAAREGITAIISTSHSDEGSLIGYRGMAAMLEDVRTAWSGVGLDIRLELGLEIYMRPGTAYDLKEGRLWTLAGSQYALVELPYEPWPAYAESALFNLQVSGYIPILAHPERYTAIQADPNLMYSLVEKGILGQVTAMALVGQQGNTTKKCAETLVRHGLVQFISSDAHGLSERKRAPILSVGLEAAEKLVGPEAALAMVTTNPAHILEGKSFVPTPERVPPRKWSLGGLFGKG